MKKQITNERPRIRHNYDGYLEVTKPTRPTEDLTIPDMGITVKDIITKQEFGTLATVQRQRYSTDTPMPELIHGTQITDVFRVPTP